MHGETIKKMCVILFINLLQVSSINLLQVSSINCKECRFKVLFSVWIKLFQLCCRVCMSKVR